MDLSFTPAEERFRADVRAWLATHVPASPERGVIAQRVLGLPR